MIVFHAHALRVLLPIHYILAYFFFPVEGRSVPLLVPGSSRLCCNVLNVASDSLVVLDLNPDPKYNSNSNGQVAFFACACDLSLTLPYTLGGPGKTSDRRIPFSRRSSVVANPPKGFVKVA